MHPAPFDTRTVFLCKYFGRADFDKGRQTAETIKNDPAGRGVKPKIQVMHVLVGLLIIAVPPGSVNVQNI